jgi:hypothetical protein
MLNLSGNEIVIDRAPCVREQRDYTNAAEGPPTKREGKEWAAGRRRRVHSFIDGLSLMVIGHYCRYLAGRFSS